METQFDNIIENSIPVSDELDTFGLISLEYSKHVEEKKTYPLDGSQPVFAVCWKEDVGRNVCSTLRPVAMPYSVSKRFPLGCRTQLHTHDYIELGYVISGTFRQSILGKEVVFTQGDLCLIDKNCVHQDFLDECDARMIFMGISKEVFEDIMSRKYANDRILQFLQSALLQQKSLLQYLHFKPYPGTDEKMRENMNLLLKELDNFDGASDLICRGLLIRIFQLLGTGYEFSLSRELKKAKNWLFYEEITDYIKVNYKSVSLEELCEKFHFQQDYFARLLKKQTGMTFIGYVQDIRLEEAKRLLLETDMAVEDISEAVGYQNKGYFYRIFEKKFGCTPAKMRK